MEQIVKLALFLCAWITIPRYASSYESRYMCAAFGAERIQVPEWPTSACPKDVQGILVDQISLSEEQLEANCYDDDNKRLTTGTRLNLSRAIHKSIDLELRRSCNGRARCEFHPFATSVAVDGPNVDKTYHSYIIQYTCRPVVADTKAKNTFDISENFEEQNLNGRSTLVIRFSTPQRRRCVVESGDEKIALRPLWSSNVGQDDKACNLSFRLFSEAMALNIDCRYTTIRYIFKGRTSFQIDGDNGFVWLEVTASTAYDIACHDIEESHTIIRPTYVVDPTETAPTTANPSSENTLYTQRTTTLVWKKTTGTRLQADDDDSVKEYMVIVTSTLAVVAMAFATLLLVYVCYIRKNSSYQRRRSSRKLQRQQQQQQHQQQQQQQQQQPQHPQQREQQRKDLDVQTYAEYTYVNPNHENNDSDCLKGNGHPPNMVSSLPWAEYSTPGGDSGTYSNVPSPARRKRQPNDHDGDYNQFGGNTHDKDCIPGNVYNTTVSGVYTHFNDVNEIHQTSENVYDG